MTNTQATSASDLQHDHQGSTDQYKDFLDTLYDDFNARTALQKALYTTDATGLWETFIENLPSDQRQHHQCRACQRFVETYGGLVAIDAAGYQTPIMWVGVVPVLFRASFREAALLVMKARVTGVHVTDAKTWGTPHTPVNKPDHPGWHHMAVIPPAHLVAPPSKLKTPGQVAAERVQEYGMLQRGLVEYTAHTVTQALGVLESEALYRTEKVIGPARWLSALHETLRGMFGRQRENLVWQAVATAPTGFCHVKTTMISTLLDDIVAGLPFETVKRRFADKMHPLQYQRPQAAPSAGNIAQAEAIVAKLGLAPALRRRFARLDEVLAIWKPTPPAKLEAAGVFGHLVPKGATAVPSIVAKAPPMTWTKFARDVLPAADRIEHFTDHRHFLGLATAVDPEAPPILQWDSTERRNPVSWYLWSGGASPSQFGLPTCEWVPVTAVTLLPCHWYGGHEHQGQGAVLLLEGARETRRPSGCLFPEILKSELREVRATIEAYSRSATLQGLDQASAFGADLRKGQTFNARVRVTTRSGTVTEYLIDRWE